MGTTHKQLLYRCLALGAAFLGTPDVALAESAFGKTSGTVERIKVPSNGRLSGDGVYGRFNGDLSLQIGAGVEADFQTSSVRPLITGDLTIYQTLGAYGSYRMGVGASDPYDHVLSVGAVLSPLFLIRWPRDLATGSPTLDLAIDSLSVHGGLLMRGEPGSSLFRELGAELGLGCGLPLLGRANGPWLRTRGQLHTGEDLGGSAWIWLSWQGFVQAGLLKVDR